jgi:two-component system, cell cycle sensor histidine kinase and response regulator CckA
VNDGLLDSLSGEGGFERILALLPAAVLVHQAGRIVFVNPTAVRLLGARSADDLVGTPALDVVHPDCRAAVLERIRKTLSTDAVAPFLEEKLVRLDGTPIDAEVSAVAFAYRGQPAVCVTALDVGERKQSQEELRRSEEKFKALFDATVDPLFIHGSDGRLLEVNPAACERLGYSRDELLAMRPSDIESFPPRPLRQPDTPRSDEGGLRAFETSYRCRDGRSIPVELTARCIQFDGQPAVLSSARDISDRLLVAQAQRLESIGQLAAGIAHDLNNLLQPILGYSELMLSGSSGDDPNYQSTLQIVEAGRRSRDLIRQLLAFGRGQALETKVEDVRGIAHRMAPLLRRTIRENIGLHITSQDEPCAALVDSGQIEQVLLNLAVNAQDAMLSGGMLAIDVSKSRLEPHRCVTGTSTSDEPYVLLTVSDTGAGMDAETQERMFEPFFTTKGAAGTGLGLATVYGIVRQHCGHILVDSTIGRGTTFRIYLPASRVSSAVEAVRELADSPRGAETLLVVEDDERVRRLTTKLLQQHGYRVIAAGSGAEALDLRSGAVHVDLLISDVVMPGLDGAALFRRLSAAQPGLRVLFMSGYSHREISRSGDLYATRPLLRKPFTVHELTTAVRSALDAPEP